MNDKTINLLITALILLFLIGIELILPKLTRRELYFGIRIPKKGYNHPKLKHVYKKYVTRASLISVPLAILIMVAIYLENNPFILVFGILGIVVTQFILYYLSHREVKALKQSENWSNLKEEYVVIDTNYTAQNRSKLIASPWWFLVSLGIIVFNVIILFQNYDTIPDRIPIHWGTSGVADQWIDKTNTSIFLMPAIQLLLAIVLFFAYKGVAWAKQQIDASSPEESKEKNRIFRLRWSRYLVATLIAMQVLLTVVNFASMDIIKVSPPVLTVFMVVCTIGILIVTILISVKTGQGGSRVKLKSKSKKNKENKETLERDDDQNWKLGLFYFNPDDPSVFVEKRFGVGFTINFGRPAALLVIGGIILFIVLSFILPDIL